MARHYKAHKKSFISFFQSATEKWIYKRLRKLKFFIWNYWRNVSWIVMTLNKVIQTIENDLLNVCESVPTTNYIFRISWRRGIYPENHCKHSCRGNIKSLQGDQYLVQAYLLTCWAYLMEELKSRDPSAEQWLEVNIEQKLFWLDHIEE